MKIKLMNGKVLAQLIGSIGTARVKLDEQVQIACVQVIGQSVVHSNTTPANSLLEAVSKHHKATVVAYLEKYGNFAWDRKADKLAFRRVFENSEAGFEQAIEALGDAKWYDAKKPPKVVSQYDVAEELAALFDRMRKAAKKGITLVNKPVMDAAEAAYNAAMVAAYNAGEKSVEQQAIDAALAARKLGTATPAQLKMLSEHFGKPVTQVEISPSAKEEATLAEAAAARKAEEQQFGGQPLAVAQ